MEPKVEELGAWQYVDKDGNKYLRLNKPGTMWFKPLFADGGDPYYGFKLLGVEESDMLEEKFEQAGGVLAS